MSEGEKQVLAMKLYDNWHESDTTDSLEIYCYQQGIVDERQRILGMLILSNQTIQ